MPEGRTSLYDDPGEERKRRRLLYGEQEPNPLPSLLPAGSILAPAQPAPVVRQPLPGLRLDEQSPIFDRAIEQAERMNQKGIREREIYRDINTMSTLGLGTVSPNENYEFEGSKDHLAEKRRQDYMMNDPEAAFLQPDRTIADPKNDSGNAVDAFRNVANFMFSDEMGLLGMKWDQEAFSWNLTNFKNQFVEHPYSTAFTLASYIVPIGLAWTKGSRIAERGARLAQLAGAVPGMAKVTRGILGGIKFDNHAQLVQTLAHTPLNDGRKFFSDSVMDGLKKATSPEEVEALVSRRDLNDMLIGDWYQERFLELRNLAKAGQLNGVRQKASWMMWQKFGNQYFKTLTDMNKAEVDNMNEFFEKADFGRYLAAAPTRLARDGEQAIYKYWNNIGGRDLAGLAKIVGANNAAWAHEHLGRMTKLFQEQADEGFLTRDQVDLFMNRIGSGAHVPAVLRNTPGFEDLGAKVRSAATTELRQLVPEAKIDIARGLTGPTTKHRARFTSQGAILDSIDELETNPRKLFIGGYVKDNVLFQIHRNFRDIIMDSIKSPTGKWGQMVTSQAAYDAMPNYAKKQWMHFDELNKVADGLGDRVRRMVDAQVTKQGLNPADYADLPMLDRAIVDQFFGQENSAAFGASAFPRFLELMTAVHKTARTALNIPTHMSNVVGNFMFLAMAGMNPFSAQALNDGRKMTGLFTKLARQHHASGESVEALMQKANLEKMLGKDRYIKDKLGKDVDLADLFSTEPMKQLVEAQSFDNIEGLRHTNKLLQHLESLENGGWGDKALETVARSIAGVGEVPGIKQTLNTMSSAYLGEDMVPKMMYAMNLARRGYGHDAIIREIGRRMPQYGSVGQIPSGARRIVLPWVTFPAEVARIMKNNMMDRPVQMMAWMQAPQIAQASMSGMGIGPDFKDYTDIMNAAPPWAVRYQTVLANGEEAPEVLGALGMGAAGGIAGMGLGGAKGAAVGMAAGSMAGAAIGRAFGEDPDGEIKDFNRAWTMDFLPQSALFPASLHPSEWEKVLPSWMGGEPTPGGEAFATAKDLTPVEPFAVFMPLLDLYSGRGAFGAEIKSQSLIEHANKMALGLLGHLAPPIMQKYGMKLEGPGGAIIPMGDIMDANGGQMTLPKHVTATFFGLAAAGLTFMGASRGLGAKGASLLASTALSGVAGGMAGSEVNTRRLMTDLGISPDPRTGEYGDWTMDFLANSIFGLNKSWKATPGQAATNESFRQKRFVELRNSPVKEFRDAINTGRESDAKSALAEIYKTYVYEHGDTQAATREFNDWMQRQMKSIQGLPVYQHFSEERLKSMIAGLEAAGAEKTKMQRHMLVQLRTELQQRQLRKAANLKVVKQPGQ